MPKYITTDSIYASCKVVYHRYPRKIPLRKKCLVPLADLASIRDCPTPPQFSRTRFARDMHDHSVWSPGPQGIPIMLWLLRRRCGNLVLVFSTIVCILITIVNYNVLKEIPRDSKRWSRNVQGLYKNVESNCVSRPHAVCFHCCFVSLCSTQATLNSCSKAD